MSQQRSAAFALACSDCGVRKETDTANEAMAFYERHDDLTGHDLAWERADLDVDPDAVATDDVWETVDRLGERYEEGVPVGVITAVMSERGLSIRETLAEIYDLRMRGKLYEPRDDHLDAF